MPENEAFALAVLEAKEKAGKQLTPDQQSLLTSLRNRNSQRRQGGMAGATIEPEVYHGGVTGTPHSGENPFKKVEENLALRQSKKGGQGGSTG